MADAYSGNRVTLDGPATSAVRGYEPSRLTVASGKLGILTNKGISITGINNQINALGVGFDASQGSFTIETALVNPYKGTNDEQAGIWYGLNDKTFLRLAINNNRVVLRREINDASPLASDLIDVNRRNTASISGLDKKTVRLRMLVNPATATVEAFYSVDGTNFINVGEAYPVKGLSIEGMGITTGQAYAGVFGTYRNGATAVTYTFDDFSISPQGAVINHPPVASLVASQDAPVGTAFRFTLADTTFRDADQDVLTLSASLTDGSALPSWLSFDAASRTFSGTPLSAAVYPVRLTATDGKSPAVSTEFTITASAV
ncbi:putative Ig domain-containing protein, partial [Dyadobacter flavalbus]